MNPLKTMIGSCFHEDYDARSLRNVPAIFRKPTTSRPGKQESSQALSCRHVYSHLMFLLDVVLRTREL